MKTLNKTTSFLENLDSYRDKALLLFIKPYWPRIITPNHVTYVRVLIGIILIILLFFLGIKDKTLIVTLFIIGLLTDFIDGPIARGTNRVTELGAMLDSTADRLIIIPIAVYSLMSSHKWLLLTLIIVEIANGLSSIYYKSKEVYLESNIFGKIKMAIMSVALIGILFIWPNRLPLFLLYVLLATIPFSFLSILSRVLELKNNK